MAELPPLRPIGTEFEEVIETPTERTIKHLKVVSHIYRMDETPCELIETLSTVVQPKSIPAPTEKK